MNPEYASSDFYLSGTFLIIITIAIIVSIFINALPFYILTKKAGVKNAWLNYIPLLNFIPFFHIIGKSSWNSIIIYVPFIGTIMGIIWIAEFLKVYGRNPLMILLILFLPGFSFIYFYYMAFAPNVRYELTNNPYSRQ